MAIGFVADAATIERRGSRSTSAAETISIVVGIATVIIAVIGTGIADIAISMADVSSR